MPFDPTALDAIDVYVAAAASYRMPINALERPTPSRVKQISTHVFRILLPTQGDASSGQPEGIAICLYDRRSRLWYVRLQDGVILRVAHDGENGSFSVAEALPRRGDKMKRCVHELTSR